MRAHSNHPSRNPFAVAVLYFVLCAASLTTGCIRKTEDLAQTASATRASSHAPFSPSPLPSNAPAPMLFVVYCNGTVDQLDLRAASKVGTFQLSDRSGTPPAVAPLPTPGLRPDNCLARPALANDGIAADAGLAHVVASAQRQRDDADGRMPYSLLTFALPTWTLQARQALGRFDVLNGAPPRVARHNGLWKTLESGEGPDNDVQTELAVWAGDAARASAQVLAWSAGSALVRYRSQATGGAASDTYALVHRAAQRVVPLDGLPGNDPEPTLALAPGGQYVLQAVRSLRAVPGGQQLVATGELRLWGPDGQRVDRRMVESVAGDWHPVTLTPQGLAVFTDRRGDYRFVPLGYRFDTAPVADPATDDLDGARPGVVYVGG